MRKKKIICVILLVLFAAAIVGVIVVKNHSVSDSMPQSYSSLEEANEAADFGLNGSDRLCGYPATDYEAASNTVKITYADAGFISKTLGEANNGSTGEKYSEAAEQVVEDRTITFKGNGEKIYLAEWNENGFSYIISVTDGVDTDEMIEYVKATR